MKRPAFAVAAAAALVVTVSFIALVRAAPARPDEVAPGGVRPLVSGHFLSGTLWQKPLLAPSNSGSTPPSGSRIDVYENFIVVTNPEGIAEISQHGSYTDLRFKPERR